MNVFTSPASALGALCLAALLLGVVPTPSWAHEEGSDGNSERRFTIQGVWDSAITLRICGTDTDLSTFRALNLFEHDGSLVATSEAARPPSLGRWQWLGGNRYRAEFLFQRFDSSGLLAGINNVVREIRMQEGAAGFTSEVSVRVLDTAGTVLSNGCGSEVAQRVF